MQFALCFEFVFVRVESTFLLGYYNMFVVNSHVNRLNIVIFCATISTFEPSTLFHIVHMICFVV